MGAYLYGFALDGPRAIRHGAWREPLRLARLRRLVLIFGELEAKPALSASSLRAQDRFAKKLFSALDPFLPARFGSFFSSTIELRAAVERNAAALGQALRFVRGAVQMNVRVFGEAAARPKPTSSSGGPGARYLTQLRDQRAWETQLPELEPLRTALGALLRGERCQRADRPPLVGSAYQLIARDALKPYRAAIKRASPELGVDLEVSGPFAPFAFAPEDPS